MNIMDIFGIIDCIHEVRHIKITFSVERLHVLSFCYIILSVASYNNNPFRKYVYQVRQICIYENSKLDDNNNLGTKLNYQIIF